MLVFSAVSPPPSTVSPAHTETTSQSGLSFWDAARKSLCVCVCMRPSCFVFRMCVQYMYIMCVHACMWSVLLYSCLGI